MVVLKKLVGDISVNFKDIFHLKNLYKMMHDWLMENGFGPDKFMEELYYQANKQTAGTEHWWWWRTFKSHNNYIRYRLDVDVHTLGIGKAEVVVDGKKIKTNTGEVDVHITGYIEYDFQNKWENSTFLKIFHTYFRERLMKRQFEAYEDEFIFDVYRFQAQIKQYLELKQFHPVDEPNGFIPAKGI